MCNPINSRCSCERGHTPTRATPTVSLEEGRTETEEDKDAPHLICLPDKVNVYSIDEKIISNFLDNLINEPPSTYWRMDADRGWFVSGNFIHKITLCSYFLFIFFFFFSHNFISFYFILVFLHFLLCFYISLSD